MVGVLNFAKQKLSRVENKHLTKYKMKKNDLRYHKLKLYNIYIQYLNEQ